MGGTVSEATGLPHCASLSRLLVILLLCRKDRFTMVRTPQMEERFSVIFTNVRRDYSGIIMVLIKNIDGVMMSNT